RAVDGAEDVDRARAARERREQRMVEVVPGFGRDKLQHAVGGVRGHAREEPAERPPVELARAAGQVRDRSRKEEEVDQELHHPLAELRKGLVRLEVEEADQIDEEERAQEA